MQVTLHLRALVLALNFLREFNFADGRLFVFCGN